MAKRFTSTEIWDEDWFLDMPVEYKLFWHYLLSSCNHAGIFKVNMRSFCGLNGVNVTSTQALEYFNNGKERIRIISDGVWLIEDFFLFQYGPTFNSNNRVHASIEKEYKKVGVSLTSIRGLKDLKDGVKDKDKDKDIVSVVVGDAPKIEAVHLEPTLTTSTLELPPIAINPNRPKDAPTLDEVIFYFTSISQSARMRKFFEHYEGTGWIDGMGRPIAHWQSKANKWVSSDIEKETKSAAAIKKKPDPPISTTKTASQLLAERKAQANVPTTN